MENSTQDYTILDRISHHQIKTRDGTFYLNKVILHFHWKPIAESCSPERDGPKHFFVLLSFALHLTKTVARVGQKIYNPYIVGVIKEIPNF